jgi:hypothetical protein
MYLEVVYLQYTRVHERTQPYAYDRMHELVASYAAVYYLAVVF